LSPLLFNIFLELIIARALNGVVAGVVLSGHVINSLRFGDNIAAVAENEPISSADSGRWHRNLKHEDGNENQH